MIVGEHFEKRWKELYMGNLRFTLLGSPEVRHADQLLLFSTRKEFALLIYLAVEGCIHLRKILSELFWPEGDALHGRAALRTTLLHLRHLLGEGASVDPVSHLLITGETLGHGRAGGALGGPSRPAAVAPAALTGLGRRAALCRAGFQQRGAAQVRCLPVPRVGPADHQLLLTPPRDHDEAVHPGRVAEEH